MLASRRLPPGTRPCVPRRISSIRKGSRTRVGRVERIWEGTSEIQRMIIARQMTKRTPAALA